MGPRQISGFEASLVYKESSRTARAIQRNPVSKKKPKSKKPKNKTKQTNKQTKNPKEWDQPVVQSCHPRFLGTSGKLESLKRAYGTK